MVYLTSFYFLWLMVLKYIIIFANRIKFVDKKRVAKKCFKCTHIMFQNGKMLG